MQELRLWSSSLDNLYFVNHVKAPGAYNSADPYNDLIYRLPLTSRINHTTYPTGSGIQPKLSAISSSFTGWTNTKPYDSLEESYYFDAPSIGSSTYDDNKIRLESNNLVGTLDVKTRAEFSQYDTAPLDNNKLGVYFSPQTMVDEDIIAQLSNIDLNQYIGDPDPTISKNSYPDLINYSYIYWQKYKDKTNINMYINMFTLFDMSFFKQLDQLLPARVNKLTGVLIQPTLLERSKLDILPDIQRFDNSYSVTIDDELIDILATDLTVEGILPLYISQSWVDETLYANTILQPTKITSSFQIYETNPRVKPTKITSSFQIYESNTQLNTRKLTVEDDDRLVAYLTASNAKRYQGTTYNYISIIQNKLFVPGVPGSQLYITASTPPWRSDASQVIIDTPHLSPNPLNRLITTFISGSQTYRSISSGSSTSNLSLGIKNHRYNGCTLTSTAFNVKSKQTVDGGPVVEFFIVNPNKLQVQAPGKNGNFLNR